MNSGYERRKYPEKSWSISKMKTLIIILIMEVIMAGYLLVVKSKKFLGD